MNDINQPVTVETPAPITVLESALAALESDSSKSVHLSASQASAVLLHIQMIEQHLEWRDGELDERIAENKQQATTILDLADRLSAYEALAHPIIEIWDNEVDEAYNE